MSKIVCVNCHVEMKPKTNGITVIETAKAFGAYKVWSADLLQCPVCGIEVVAGFGNYPIRQDHYADDFLNGWKK